ncbi:hypothetical protein [Chryseolinea lacunae]|uniref:Uncharacterized protein n=1 Tax=Chryseolinea lacunae TaxID=2801331 RepID=A0ABS1KUG9_9BACT|nr:hypothetical protein [Chryseolinea lacunae]MBL0741966.1 hypothetical protein [Chryseolinea lacunae]
MPAFKKIGFQESVGIVGLSLFAVFLFFSLGPFPAKLRVLEVNYWDPRDADYSPFKYVNKKFEHITLTGNKDEDAIKLKDAQLAIQDLMNDPDSSKGIEFTFKDDAKYGTLVSLFSICKKQNVRSYLNYHDKFWVFNFKPNFSEPPYRTSGICGGTLSHILIPEQPQKNTFLNKNSPWRILCFGCPRCCLATETSEIITKY